MKVLILFLALVPFINWEPDFENAKKLAKSEHKLILLNFSGSDWCGPCIMLRRDYLESDTFTKMANENLVLVNADFPRKKKNQLPPELIKRNDVLAEKYDKDGNFPFTILLDSNGKVMKTWTGKPEVSVETWVSEIKNICIGSH